MHSRDFGFRFPIARRGLLLAAIGCCRFAYAADAGEAGPATLKGVVISANGQPVAGAVVAFTGARRQNVAPEAIETRTDAKGLFTLALPRPARLPGAYFGTVWAHTPGEGIALHELTEPAKSEVRLELPAGSQTRIKVVTPDGAPAVGAKVMHTGVRIAEMRDGRQVYGAAALPDPIAESTAVITDSTGVAALTAMTSDEISGVRCATPEWGSQEARRPHETQGEAILRLRRVGRLRGQVVCAQPAAARCIKVQFRTSRDNVKDWNTAVEGHAIVTTDEEGRFEAPFLAEGSVAASATPGPDAPFLPKSAVEAQLLAGGEATVSIELQAAVRVRGVVREKGLGPPRTDPILVRNLAASSFGELELDRAGRYEFFAAPGSTIEILSALRDDRHSWIVYSAAINAVGQTFDVPPLELVTAPGRIVDRAGRPVPAAKIEQAWMRYEVDGRIAERRLRYGGEAPLLSADSGGRFEVQVAANHAYRLLISAEGMRPTQTDWVDFSRPEVNAFPDIVLHDSRTLSGRVTDRQGRPLAGARVFQAANHLKRTEAVANDEGEFKLDGLSAGSAFVFAGQEGFRFHGQIVSGDAERLEIVLTRSDEAPERLLNPLPSLLTPGDELTLARRLMQSQLEKALASQSHGARRRALAAWATIDPHDALKRLEHAKLVESEEADAVRIAGAMAFAAKDADETQKVLQSIRNHEARLSGFVQAADELPESAREVKLRLLAACPLLAEQVEEPMASFYLLAHVARARFRLGEKEQAEQLTRRLVKQVKDVACDPDECCGMTPRGAAAVALALFDLDAALKQIPRVSAEQAEASGQQEERLYLLASMASAVAASNPDGAERVLGLMDEPFQRAQAVASVCFRMAPGDLPRARRLAASIEAPGARARAYAALADALGSIDRAVAVECLDESFRSLALSARDAETADIFDARTASGLLPLVEELAPERLSELMWLAVWLNHSEEELSLDADYQAANACAVAAFVGRYDRQAASLVLGDPAATVRRIAGSRTPRNAAAFFTSLAAIDPHKAAELLALVPDKSDDDERESPREASRRAIVQFLAAQGEARRRTLKRLVGIAEFSEDEF